MKDSPFVVSLNSLVNYFVSFSITLPPGLENDTVRL